MLILFIHVYYALNKVFLIFLQTKEIIYNMDGRCYIFFLLLTTATKIQYGAGEDDHHHHDHFADCNGHDCKDVTKALEHIGKHFDSHLCQVFSHVDCSLHPVKHDETVCGSDGNLYNSHCSFVKARCFQILNGQYDHHHHLINPLDTEHHNFCTKTYHSPSTTATTSTSIPHTHAVSTTGNGSTSKAATTQLPQTTSTQATLTTTVAPMTAHNIVGSVFCQYRGVIDCGSTLSVLCGTDGQFYPNTCELLKEQCVNFGLQENPDITNCMHP
ncbi:uncharacterized protein LOC132753300 [Ruditapes philippinarum]|uniref:uncharacterized protein LOC132753300 n=1 Tax=Ruditapes philippinarum TaxID=129788 RepID=UPI00295AA9CE|nr:uncharacterized protein LOC132753300 [Ruditapes philippinarum]